MAVERFSYDRLLGTVDKYKVIDLYPYKFQNIDNFIFRDHIPYQENSEESRNYALDTWRKCTDGHWVNDEGTWVWMPPKLYFYVNLGTIDAAPAGSKSRSDTYPDLRDNEWIAVSYLLCCDGFSGFKDDPDFTCNRIVRDLEDGEEISPYLLEKIKKHCTRKDGTWKKYVEAFDYLTWFYHKVNPRPFSLGLPLYENPSADFSWLASRGWGKTWFTGGGDCAHEFWTNGAMYFDELSTNPKTSMMMGATNSKFIDTFMGAVRTSFTNIPGGKYGGNHGYFTKTATNDWDGEKGIVEQIFRRSDGTYGGSRSKIGKAVIPPNNASGVVSTRSKRIYIDEKGTMPNYKQVVAAAGPTLKDPSGKFGVLIGMGTGGMVDKIAETQYVYTNPLEFDVYGLPNWWADGKLIGLFGPASYVKKEFKDKNGNTDLMAATKAVIADRVRTSGGDISKQTEKRMNEPLEPAEIFLSGKSEVFAKDLIIERIDVLRPAGHNVFRKKGEVCEIELGAARPDGLYETHIRKTDEWNQVVDDYLTQSSKAGRLVIFEHPKGDGREFLEYNNLYKVIVDPKTDMETGESFHSIKVWKGRPQRTLEKEELFHNIVATAKVKEDGLLIALLLCLYYKARCQYERNVNGTPEFFNKYGLRWLLQPTPLAYIKDIIQNTRQIQESGIFMNAILKREALALFKKFHKQVAYRDWNDKVIRNVETWYDISLLSEMNFYDAEKNFDDISCMLILMLWLEAEYMPDNSKFAGDEPDGDPWGDLAGAATRILN